MSGLNYIVVNEHKIPRETVVDGDGRTSQWAQCPVCHNKDKLPKGGGANNFIKHVRACLKLVKPNVSSLEHVTQPLSRLTIISESHVPSRTSSPHASSSHSHLHGDTTAPCTYYYESIIIDDPAHRTQDCPGFVLRLVDALSRYPFAAHQSSDLGWFPTRIDQNGSDLYAQSIKCTGNTDSPGAACGACTRTCSSTELKQFLERVAQAPPHTPYQYLSYEQLLVLIRKYKSECKQLRSKLASSQQAEKRAREKISIYKRINKLLALNNIAGFRRIMYHAVKTRAMSPKQVLHQLERAIEGRYKPRGGYNLQEIQISFLAKVAAGPRFLGVLNRADGYATEATIRDNFDIPHLLVSLTRPTALEINSNLSAFFTSELLKPPAPIGIWENRQNTGVALIWDGVAIEKRCQYCPIRDAPLGLCREHSQHWPSLRISDDLCIQNMKAALCASASNQNLPKLCYGKEATVFAIAPITPMAPTNAYHAIPFIISASCKQENFRDFRSLLELITECWNNHPDGRAKYGPIIVYGSDGDSTSRAARHQLCVNAHVKDVDATLYNLLRGLPGLNLRVSETGATHTCDYKHLWKRFCTLLRNLHGIMVFGTLIVPSDFQEALISELGVTEDESKELFDWNDKQNVPKTTRLLQRLTEIPPLPTTADRRLRNVRTTICFMAAFMNLFFLPFVDTTMTLSEQIEYLAAYAHVAAALQLENGTSCITGEVYSDTQAVVKNIIFTLARLQCIDGDICLYIMLDGTDRLELVFSAVRTWDHSTNFDIMQLGQKISLAAVTEAIYMQNPHLDRGHKRLKSQKLDGSGIDHTRPQHWDAEAVRVGDVCLELVWENGRLRAMELLNMWFPEDEHIQHVDFCNYFKGKEDTHDFLRVSGDYIGISSDKNSHKSESSEEKNVHSNRSQATWHDEPTEYETGSDTDDNYEHFVAEHTTDTHNKVPSQSSEPVSVHKAVSDAELDIAGASDAVVNMHHSSAKSLQPADKIVYDLLVNGKQISKASRVARELSTHESQSKDRNQRVQGKGAFENSIIRAARTTVSVEPKAAVIKDDLLVKNDYLAGLAQSATGVAFVMYRVVHFVKSGKQTMSILESELDDAHLDVMVAVQALELEPFANDPELGHGWEWRGSRPLACSQATTRSLKATQNKYIFMIPSRLLAPLALSVVDGDPRWSQDALEGAMSNIWEIVNPPHTSDLLTNITFLPDLSAEAKRFPYRCSEDGITLELHDIPITKQIGPPLKADSIVPCLICKDRIKLKAMREHVGHHILQCLRSDSALDHKEWEDLNAQISTHACGFCGLNTARSAGCITQLVYSNTGSKVRSTCPYYYTNTFNNLETKRVWSKTNKCTNLPMHCHLCPPGIKGVKNTIWSYSFVMHMAEFHLVNGALPPMDRKTWLQAYVSRAEEEVMGITLEDTANWRMNNDVPDSDAIELMGVEAVDEETNEEHKGDQASDLDGGVKSRAKRPRSGTILSNTSGCVRYDSRRRL